MAMSADMLKDIKLYARSTIEDCEKLAKKVQRKMKREIPSTTPYRDYSTTGPEDKVARQIAAEKGHLRDDWGLTTFKSKKKGTQILKIDSKYYGVRSRNKPQLVHLLNFPRKIVLWGKPTNRTTHPTPFVDNESQKGMAELEKLLDQYFR